MYEQKLNGELLIEVKEFMIEVRLFWNKCVII